MHVVSYKRIREFTKDHPDSIVSLSRWYRRMKKGKFNTINELKRKFSDVDYIGNDRYIFNICGNKYRLVALINFCKKKVFIRFIGTHTEYSEVNSKII